MKDVSLPDAWTGWCSAAVLMTFSGRRAGIRLSKIQQRLICWELEKYGPCYCEPSADSVIRDALRFFAQQRTPDGDGESRELVRFHASLLLARRGREALNLTLAACARVRAYGPRGEDPALQLLLHDACIHSVGQAMFRQKELNRHLGADEAQDYADFGVLQPLPDAAESEACLRAAVEILKRPPGWTSAHALAFLVYAGHVTDRQAPGPLPELANDILDRLAPQLGHSGNADELLPPARALYDRCENRRFVVLRAIEDQLMHFVYLKPDERKLILNIVNAVASAQLTAYRRAIVTATMTVLATSNRALQRERCCPDWPV